MKANDLTNKNFGRLTALTDVGSYHRGAVQLRVWLCECECGETVKVPSAWLRNGQKRSCGCLKRETTQKRVTTHGMSGTKIYRVWARIKKRAKGNSDEHVRRYYGSKDIDIDPTWLSFEAFYQWAKDKYRPGLDIDRIDTLKGYGPNNCRFVTRKKNCQNTKRSKYWVVHGKVFSSSNDAAKFFGYSQQYVCWLCDGRLYNGKRRFYQEPFCYSVKKYEI